MVGRVGNIKNEIKTASNKLFVKKYFYYSYV